MLYNHIVDETKAVREISTWDFNLDPDGCGSCVSVYMEEDDEEEGGKAFICHLNCVQPYISVYE